MTLQSYSVVPHSGWCLFCTFNLDHQRIALSLVKVTYIEKKATIEGLVFGKVISTMKNIVSSSFLSCLSLQSHLCLLYEFAAEVDNKSIFPVSNFRHCTAGVLYIHLGALTQFIFYFSLRSQPNGWSSFVTVVTIFVQGDSWGPSECIEAAHHHLISLSQPGDTERRVGVGGLSAYE